MLWGISQQPAHSLRCKLKDLRNSFGWQTAPMAFNDGVSGHTRMLEDRDATHLAGNGLDFGAVGPVYDWAFV